MKQFNYCPNPQVVQKSDSIILAYKPLGYTPLEVIRYIQKHNTLYKKEKVGYAGRLDPMAEGLLLLLVGDENKKKVHYEQMTKEYRFECTFGIKTDTLDILGLIAHVNSANTSNIFLTELEDKLSRLQGNISLQYPLFSAKRVKGKPLYFWARSNQLNTIKIPSARVFIHSIKLNKKYETTGEEIATRAIERVAKVNGDFRQEEIIKDWQNLSTAYGATMFPVADITAQVSSGTYIRSLCEVIAKQFSLNAIATNIMRTAIGDYHF